MSFIGLLGFLFTRFGLISQANNQAAKTFWEDTLNQNIPERAILISNDRNEIMPLWYYQFVEQRRPDLQGLFPLITPDPTHANIGLVLEQALATDRPVYLIKPMDGLNLKANLIPHGKLYKATPHRDDPNWRLDRPLPEIVVENQSESIVLVGYSVYPTSAMPGQEITVTLYWQVTQPLSINYTSYLHLINDQGQGVTQSDHRPGGDFYPSSYWKPGEMLHDRHTLHLPDELTDGIYKLRAGLYYQPEPGQFIGMGPGEIIGDLPISR